MYVFYSAAYTTLNIIALPKYVSLNILNFASMLNIYSNIILLLKN